MHRFDLRFIPFVVIGIVAVVCLIVSANRRKRLFPIFLGAFFSFFGTLGLLIGGFPKGRGSLYPLWGPLGKIASVLAILYGFCFFYFAATHRDDKRSDHP